MAENQNSAHEEPVCTTWARMVEVVLGLFLLVGTGFMAHYYAPAAPLPVPAPTYVIPHNDHQDELRQLTRDVDELKQEQAMPALVLNRYRNSICYIFGVYRVAMPGKPAALRARISGTGFVVAEGLLATNRHVAEPWDGDAEADALIHKGARAELGKLVACGVRPSGLPARRYGGGQRTGSPLADPALRDLRTPGRCSGRQTDLRRTYCPWRQRRPGIQLAGRGDRHQRGLHRRLLRRDPGRVSAGVASADCCGTEKTVEPGSV